MSEIKVTKERIEHLLNSGDAEVRTVFKKCTVVTLRLENGFTLVESSGCVDPANYDQELGKKLCYEHLENRLWELEGYALQKEIHERKLNEVCCDCGPGNASGDFGWALNMMRHGWAVCRRGWNGKGIFIKLQEPDEHSKMTSPYIYIDTTGLRTDNPAAPKSRVPWLASQTDMLAEDWELAI